MWDLTHSQARMLSRDRHLHSLMDLAGRSGGRSRPELVGHALRCALQMLEGAGAVVVLVQSRHGEGFSLLEGSEIRLNERRYEAEPSVINFVDERRIFPSFDLHLNTTASNYEISIAVTGTPGDTETTLTSTPSLPEPDIMAMLVTGRTLDQMRGAHATRPVNAGRTTLHSAVK